METDILKRIEEERKRRIIVEKLLSQILTQEAKERLGRIKIANPSFASQVEDILIRLYLEGRIKKRISDKEFKEFLRQVYEKTKKEFRIRF